MRLRTSRPANVPFQGIELASRSHPAHSLDGPRSTPVGTVRARQDRAAFVGKARSRPRWDTSFQDPQLLSERSLHVEPASQIPDGRRTEVPKTTACRRPGRSSPHEAATTLALPLMVSVPVDAHTQGRAAGVSCVMASTPRALTTGQPQTPPQP